jgi:transposase
MQEGLFTLAKLDDFVPPDHPLRAIHALVNEALIGLNGLFNTIYAETGRASIAPEKLMRAMLIQVLFSVRSERQLMEQRGGPGCSDSFPGLLSGTLRG